MGNTVDIICGRPGQSCYVIKTPTHYCEVWADDVTSAMALAEQRFGLNKTVITYINTDKERYKVEEKKAGTEIISATNKANRDDYWCKACPKEKVVNEEKVVNQLVDLVGHHNTKSILGIK